MDFHLGQSFVDFGFGFLQHFRVYRGFVIDWAEGAALYVVHDVDAVEMVQPEEQFYAFQDAWIANHGFGRARRDNKVKKHIMRADYCPVSFLEPRVGAVDYQCVAFVFLERYFWIFS